MTTITPTAAFTVPLRITLDSPLHHGAGSSGNTAVLRTQEVITADGQQARVPFVSGASVRHALREAIAWHLVEHAGITDGSMTKAAVDLMWTGGAVTTTGAQTDLEMIREVDTLLPSLAMFGYAARSDIITGTLRASDLILECQENSGRLPADADASHRAAAYRSEEFGTRHDIASSPVARYVQALDGIGGKTTQMIWDTQVLKAGARLSGELTLTPAATSQHEVALGAAIALWAPDGHAVLGAKSAQGYGRVRLSGYDADWAADCLRQWTDHIQGHANAIRDLIGRVSA